MVHHEDHLPCGFTLIELLVVVGIIALLVGMLLPALGRAREQSKVVACASNLKQIAMAFNMYLLDSQGQAFWRGTNIGLDGMDWYVYGGKETGCTCLLQNGLFNKFQPRPLNKYVLNKQTVFQCPSDFYPIPWTDDVNNSSTCFDWVGNSYHFNADGYPGGTGIGDDAGNPFVPDPTAGLDGAKVTQFKDSSDTVLFFDAAMAYDVDWHPQGKGNVCYLDSHVSFQPLPNQTQARWK